MWNKTVTLYVDDTSIRLLVMQGQRVKKWAGIKLEPGLIIDSIVLQEEEIAARIKQLLESQKVKTRKVVLGFSGLHSLTRPATLPKLPKSMLAEAVIREARRVLPVPLDQLYLSWQSIPGHKERSQVFMVAIPRKTADSLVNTLKIAGLEASRMSIKPLVLTKALALNTMILVDLQPDEFDIVILSGGVAQPIRTVKLPSEELTWEEKINTIASDLNRTIKFFDTNNPEKKLDHSIPIYVSGELIQKNDLQKSLSEITGHPVSELLPVVKSPERIDLGYYMVNITMAMKIISSVSENTYPVANLNVLPVCYQPKPISLTKVTGIPGGIALAGLVVPLVMLMQNTSANIEAMEKQVAVANQVIVQKTTQKNELKKSLVELEKKAASAKITFEKTRKPLDNIRSTQEIVNGDLLVTLSNLSPQISLNSLSESGNMLVIRGEAPSEEDVSSYTQAIIDYARTLDLSNRFSQSTISSIKVSTSVREQEPGENQAGSTNSKKIEFLLTFQRGKK
ncbi:MAG: pilus assembly protein PilM [Dehalococcoidales bacterium]|nr:pilus assembly protein PilM [Dehalococcoidales bacterium]